MNIPLFTFIPFYDPPLYNSVTKYLKIIETEFKIKVKKYRYLKWAFGNDVFIINDEVIIRFPRTEKTKKHLKYEIDFLKHLKPKVNINIPNYTYISKNKEFAGYNIIKGTLLTPALFKTLSKKNKEKAVEELIEFINVFHKLNINEFKKFKPLTREYFIPIEKRVLKELKEKLYPKLSKKEVEAIESLYSEARKYLIDIPTICPTHRDIYAYNVIWDKKRSKIGIIDFSDYTIADPAKDFEVFYDYGTEYVQKAYEMYNGPKDPDFLKRAELYYKAHGIFTLLSSLLGAKISFDYAYNNFFKKKFDL